MGQVQRRNHFFAIAILIGGIAAVLITHLRFGLNLFAPFRTPDGHTNWQYVVNWSSGLFIVLLLLTTIGLMRSRKRAKDSRRELRQARDELERRVEERTRSLQRNQARLEEEIDHNKVTEQLLRSTQAYMDGIIQSMPVTLIGVTGDGFITQWNQRAEETTGLTSQDVLHHQLWEVYRDIPIQKQLIEESLESRQPVQRENILQGSRYLNCKVYPFHWHDEPNAVIMIDDVTQRVQAENMLIHKDKTMAMGELAAGMAHDINNPLSAILQSVSTLQRRLTQDLPANVVAAEAAGTTQAAIVDYVGRRDVGELLQGIADSGERCADIVKNLLNFARTRSHTKQLVDIVDLLESTLDLARNTFPLQPGLHFQDIQIERDYGPELREFPCYGAEIQQVLLNLFRNACHAMQLVDDSEHIPRLKIRVAKTVGTDKQDLLEICVSDNGAGMTEETRQHLFEPFFTTKEFADGEGSGLGLSVSHFIVTEHHQGQITVDSEVSRGSTFRIALPYPHDPNNSNGSNGSNNNSRS